MIYCCYCSVTKLCPPLCNPKDCSTPGFPVLVHLLELAQTHVHSVGDAIQPSRPLPLPYPLPFSLSHHQGLSHESALHIRWPKFWSFSFSISPSVSIQDRFPLGWTSLILLSKDSVHILTILIIQIYLTWDILLLIDIFFNFFHQCLINSCA